MHHDATIKTLVNKIHKTPIKAYIACSGGGSEIFPILLNEGGGSATLIGGFIPYNLNELKRFIGPVVEKAVSEETALKMAQEAYKRAFEDTGDFSVCGIGLTASLQRVPEEREGRIHEVFAVLYSSFKTIKLHFTINLNRVGPAAYARQKEESVCARSILDLLSDFCGVTEGAAKQVAIGAKLEKYEELNNWADIKVDEEYRFVKPMNSYNYKPMLVFPGSFNPPHLGHQEMINLAKEFIGKWPCYLEISIQNVDKGELTQEQIKERINTIKNSDVHLSDFMLITKAPTFVEKAKLFPGATFIIGYDTAVRILDPKYAGPVENVLKCFEDNKINFLLFPRTINGKFNEDLSVFPDRFLQLTDFVMGFRKYGHLASKDIRAKNG
jgi:nicotinamide mononucleotide (NMN) deamidase PncC